MRFGRSKGKSLRRTWLALASSIACALVMAPQLSQASLYDLTNDFSISNGNPNGVWTYGHYTGGLDKGTFAPFNNFETNVLGSLDISEKQQSKREH